MIHEVDVALRALIERDATDGAQVEVVFDAPTKDWSSRRNVPTIDVYLYDIREDLRRRERGLINEYRDGQIAARRLPPRYFKLSYLVTAWTQRPEDEHRLLSTLLACFLRHDAIPRELLTGPLAELGLPVALTIGLPPPEDRSFADVWTALGGELKPSLDVVISTPTETGQRWVAGPAVDEPVSVSLGGSSGWPPREERRPRPTQVHQVSEPSAAHDTEPGTDTPPAGSVNPPADGSPGGTPTTRTPRRRGRAGPAAGA